MTAPWRTLELALESTNEYPHPYRDVDVELEFVGPDGQRIRRAAFWDGGRSWRVRFAPTAVGQWTYRAVAAPDGDSGLGGAAGTIDVLSEVDIATDIHRHGFLRAAAGGRHLEHADGTPFFWLGDTHWRFAWESWDDANKPGWTSQFRGIVDRRVEQGFSVYQSNLMAFGDGWATSEAWGSGTHYRDLEIGYFQEVVDPRMAYIANAGLVNAFALAWFSAVDDDPEGLARFARYLVARYGSYPMVWTLGGEVSGYDPALRASRIDRWRQVALAIRDADGYDQPRTAHLTNERPIAPYYQGEDWLTLTLHQHGHGDLDMGVGHYRTHLAKHPGVPLVEGESMYEGIVSVEPIARRTATDLMVRQVAYRAIQSGCCGYTYGAQGVWNGAWEFDQGVTMWGDLPWYEGIDLPGGAQMGHLRRFYLSLDWTRLVPDDSVFDPGGMVNAVFYPPAVSATPDRGLVVAYFGETYRNEEGAPALTGLPDVPYRMRWFDPRSGVFSTIAEAISPEKGRLAVPGKPDESTDWLLVADNEVIGSGENEVSRLERGAVNTRADHELGSRGTTRTGRHR